MTLDDLINRSSFSLILFLSLIFLGINVSAQNLNNNTADFWTLIEEREITTDGNRYIFPDKYLTFQLNVAEMRQHLAHAPIEKLGDPFPDNALQISLPMPNGEWWTFALVESPTMAPELAAQFPDIKTYAGRSIINPAATIRLDLTPQGFHAMVLNSDNRTVFIDPYAHNDNRYYIVYYKKDYTNPQKTMPPCLVVPSTEHPKGNKGGSNGAPHQFAPHAPQYKMSPDGKLRTYRLALACTGEYASFHGGTTSLALAAMNTSMNRVNGVYEREASIRMNIIANNNLIIYTNANTDPYTNNSGSTLLNENQSNINSVIGSANYDIGHIFSTGGGGVASLGSVCVNTQKARGVTGSGSPIGDPFDIDYVAHEIGHQFGGNHTFNDNNTGSCSGNRNGSTAYEVGSGSTIMAYAGICGASNVQSNSDDYFHAGSLSEIFAFITTDSGNSCGTQTNLTNAPPVVNAGSNYSIPISTPFILTGSATDANSSDVLTYCWEEMDLGSSSSLSGTLSGNMPAFRSYAPVSSTSRIFPRIATIMSNATDNTEKLPNYGRTMSFRLSVRDNKTGGGCVRFDDATVTTVAAAGPFVVTAPNATGVSLAAYSSYTVTWDVAGTTAAPINCANVDIYLILNNASSNYPQTLILANTPNDGTQSITVPNVPTTVGRIVVKCSDNIFFDVSNNNITITAPTIPDFAFITTPESQQQCAPTNAVYTLNTTSIAGFTTPIVWSVTGLPAGATANFNPPSTTPGGSSQLTISTSGVSSGNYNLTVVGTAGSITHTTAIALGISSQPPASPTLSAPLNASTGLSAQPTFTWQPVTNVLTYDIQIATDISFNNIVASGSNLTTTTYTPTSPLAYNTTYFWRVQGNNYCEGAYSPVFIFATSSQGCSIFASTNIPLNISSNGTPTVTSTLSISGQSAITDINVLNLQGTHSYMGDLRFSLTSPSNSTIVLYDFNAAGCGTQNNFNINFDDDAPATTIPCSPSGGTYPTANADLTSLIGQNPNGTWTLTVNDLENQDGGTLDGWSLQICQSTASALSGGIVANIKAFLEGALLGSSTTMATDLETANLLPLSQPFSAAPFLYAGGERALEEIGFPNNITDWILVEIWDDADVLIERRAGWLLNDGSVVEPNTTSGLRFFTLQIGQPYRVVVRHRNHLAVMSASTIEVHDNSITYDFSTSTEQALGSSQLKSKNGVSCLFAGDINADGVITVSDFNQYLPISSAINVYDDADCNTEGSVTVADFNLYLENSSRIGIPQIRY